MGFTAGMRVYPGSGGITPRLGPAEYCKDVDGRWWVRLPQSSVTMKLAEGDVTEHEDGTITVRQEIGARGFWKGRLVRGLWQGEGD